MTQPSALTADEQKLDDVWNQHLRAEFAAHSADQALPTMTAESYVNVIPLMIGGRGRDGVRDFYANHFVSQIPPDMEMVPVSRTIGQGRVVDEIIVRFTHSIRMDWFLPAFRRPEKEWKSRSWPSSSSKATRSRTNTCTGTRLRCSSNSACSIERFRFAAAKSRRKC